MFTGIVDHCGVIQSLSRTSHSCRFGIQCQFSDLLEGESILVDGVCLTAVNPEHHLFYCDVSPETMALTIVGNYHVGTKVNLERSLKLTDRMGGHFVSGHIDHTAKVSALKHYDEFTEVRIGELGEEAQVYLIKKGSIAINGTSLTINKIVDNEIEIMLIPHTLQRTNLNDLQVGCLVNVEFDMLAKMVQRMIAKQVEMGENT